MTKNEKEILKEIVEEIKGIKYIYQTKANRIHNRALNKAINIIEEHYND
jgi:hypothetical protein